MWGGYSLVRITMCMRGIPGSHWRGRVAPTGKPYVRLVLSPRPAVGERGISLNSSRQEGKCLWVCHAFAALCDWFAASDRAGRESMPPSDTLLSLLQVDI